MLNVLYARTIFVFNDFSVGNSYCTIVIKPFLISVDKEQFCVIVARGSYVHGCSVIIADVCKFISAVVKHKKLYHLMSLYTYIIP